MPPERKCENFQCKQVSIGMISIVFGKHLWLCQDHMIQILKEVQEKKVDKQNILIVDDDYYSSDSNSCTDYFNMDNHRLA